MALQPAFWVLAWRKRDVHTHRQASVWLGLLLLLLTTSIPLFSVDYFHWVLKSAMPTHLSGAETLSSPQSLPRSRLWVYLGWVHQSALGNTTHPLPHPHLPSLSHTVLYFLSDNAFKITHSYSSWPNTWLYYTYRASPGDWVHRSWLSKEKGVTKNINQSNWNHLFRPHILSIGWYQQRCVLTAHITDCTLPRICSNITHYGGENVSSWEWTHDWKTCKPERICASPTQPAKPEIFLVRQWDMCELAQSVVYRGTLVSLYCCTIRGSTITMRKDAGILYLGALLDNNSLPTIEA